MLSFAAVGFHGRECRARAVAGASLAVVAAVSVSAQPPASEDLTAQLAARIASVVTPPESIQLSTDADARWRPDLVRLLRARGLAVVDAAAVPIRVTCGQSLRDDVC